MVDDEPQAVELLQALLTAKGLAVLTASDGEEALRKVKGERPHVIPLDVGIPKLSGLEVLMRVRELDPEVGGIMVASVVEPETGRQALQLGAFDHITKPLDLAELERSLWVKLQMVTL